MTSDALIPFTRGAPSLDIIDTEGLAEATQKAFSADPAGTFGYGTAGGYLPLREWIAEQHGVDVDQVLVTNGSMQADAFLFQTLVQAGDDVVVEAPTYDRTLLSLRQRGATVHAINLETDGIDVTALRAALDGGVRPKLAHIIPNFQNPAGYTLSADKRAQLLALGAEHGFVVFEDDPYVQVRFEGEPLPTMLSQDTNDVVVYASSFSKTLAPGLRCGYLVGPKPVLAEITKLATNTYISPNMVSQSIVNEYCRSGRLDKAITAVRTALRERRDALVAALRRELPEARFTPPQGGYFMWVELPGGVVVDKLAPVAREHGVAFVNGTDFLLDGGQNAVRLAFAGLSTDQIDAGITRLAAAVRALAS